MNFGGMSVMQDEGSGGPRWMVHTLGGFGNFGPFQSCSSLVRNIHCRLQAQQVWHGRS